MSTPRTRTAPIGLVAGVLVLGLMLVLAVALPKLGGEASASVEVALPDTLAGGDYTVVDQAIAEIDPEGAVREEANADYTAEQIAAVSDVDVASRTYLAEDQQSFVAVQVVGAGGTFQLPIALTDPEAFGLARPPLELVEGGEDVLCQLNYQAPPGQPQPEEPSQVSCEYVTDEVQIRVSGSRVSLEETQALLDEVRALVAE